jgi:hypothetical protein
MPNLEANKSILTINYMMYCLRNLEGNLEKMIPTI